MNRKSKMQKERIWMRQYLKRQQNINACARKLMCPRVREGVIAVFHPGEHQRWLQSGPCPDCPVNHFCDTPCSAYLSWYDQRMDLVRQLCTSER